MPVTLLYASILGLLFLVLAGRVGRMRQRHRVSVGTGGNAEVERAMRVQANFVEYVPLMLILMALLEGLGAAPFGLHAVGIPLVAARLLHALGLSRSAAPNAPRAVGTVMTVVLFLVLCLWGLSRVISGFGA